MPVAQNVSVSDRAYPFSEIVSVRRVIVPIDVRAIFYTYANPKTEFLANDDYVTDNTELAYWESNNG